jgi:cytidylate kinase
MTNTFPSQNIRNITISGRAASGATTLSRLLSEKIGWELINGGEIYRQYVKKKGIPLEKTTQVSDEYHKELDLFIQDKLKTEEHIIVESWLSGFDAENIPGVFKIFVMCSQDAVRIDRLVNREGMTVEQAKEHIKVREAENIAKWEKMYHTRDFWNPSLYDLVIDTYTNGPTETLQLALSAIGFQ